jgi:hypothetical protein
MLSDILRIGRHHYANACNDLKKGAIKGDSRRGYTPVAVQCINFISLCFYIYIGSIAMRI